MSKSKKFDWKATSQRRMGDGRVRFQSQCRSGGGGNGKCGGKCSMG